MAGIYINKNDLEECTKIRKIGRRKKIHFTENGWYFLWNGKRVKGEDILSLTYPIFYEEPDGKLSVISGYIQLSNVYCILVQVDSDMETVQMYQEPL